jgi:hypothetical protein
MQRPYRKKGSITVFLVMILTLITSFFFALLEKARISGLDTKADVVSDVALESVFAEYQKEIYESYGLLLLDGSYGTDTFHIENVEKRLEEVNCRNLYGDSGKIRELYPLRIAECRIPGYQLATDEGGDAFRHLAAETARKEALVSVVEDFTDEIRQKEDMEIKNGKVDEHLETARKAEEEMLETEKENKNNISASNEYKKAENPISKTEDLKKSAVLSLVLKDESRLSTKAVTMKQSLKERQKEKGNLEVKSAWTDDLWFLKYLESYMGTYKEPKTNRALDYEWEYILNGKLSDRENLEKTVKNLIMIREISNLAYLVKDAKKQIEAEELAVALMGWTVNPAVITATKWGILGAWSYLESILDVRALLEGRRISWFKNSQQWSSGISQIGKLSGDFAMAKDCENGWDYKKYLQFLLCLERNKDVNYHSMELIEVNIGINTEESIWMDHMLITCKAEMDYEADPLFWRYVHLGKFTLDTFEIKRNGIYTYL